MQYVVEMPSGGLEFYIGQQVREELEATGTFVPADSKWYSRITVPSSMVPEGAEPTTVSLCKHENGIVLFDNVPMEPEQLDAMRPRPGQYVNPHLIFTNDSLVQVYRSGDEGVAGRAQVHRNSDGLLLAGAYADLAIPISEDGAELSIGAMLLGSLQDDPDLEDPLLESGACAAPALP